MQIICLSFLYVAPIASQEEIGRPLITNYSYHDYQAGPVNWWVIEDDRGIMYFANGEGILEYDGATWNKIETPNGAGVRSFAKDKNGVIHVGCEGDIGYLTPDEKGEMSFVSLKEKLPPEHRVFFEVWETDLFRDKIYFRTNDKLFRWDGDEFEVIISENGIHVGTIINDQYYLRIWNKGLCTFEGDTFRLLPGGEKFAQERIYSMLPYDEERILLGTRNDGFYLYDGRRFTPFKTDVDEQVQSVLYLPGAKLRDGRYVVNTFANGAYLIDRNGNLLQNLTKENGLQDNSVDFVYEDSRGVLWLALFNGISSINLNSKFTYMDDNMGLPTRVVFSLIKRNNIIYAGTNDGIYFLENGSKSFEHLANTSGQVGNFIILKNRLFVATGGMGLIEITGNAFKYVRRSENYDLRGRTILQSTLDSNRIYLSHEQGMSSFYFDEKSSQFKEESRTALIHPSFGGFEEDPSGNIWSLGDINGTVKVLTPNIRNGVADLNSAKVITYDSSHGLPNRPVSFWQLDGELHFSAFQEDTYTFDATEEKFSKATFSYDKYIDRSASLTTSCILDHLGRYWFNLGEGVVVKNMQSNATDAYVSDPFLEIKNANIWNIYIEEQSTSDTTIAWFMGPDGLARYVGDLSPPYLPDFAVKIRSLKVSNDSLIYAGGTELPQNLDLNFSDNTVTLGYAAPFYIGERDLEYQTSLIGLDKSWSPWTRQTDREYINLPSGDYTFKVRARNLYGSQSDETIFNFNILPPWYATWWAYLLYLIIAGLIIYSIVRGRTTSLRRQQKYLEDTVQQRTEEVQQRVEELATVNRVSQALTEKLEFNDLIQLVGEQMKQLFKSNISYLAIHDPATGIINFPYQDGDLMAPLKYGEGLTSQIIMSGEPLLINHDISTEYDHRGLRRVGKNASSYLGVPIPVEDQIIGVISVQSTEQENRFNENDKRLLSTIARHVGIALHNAELYEEAKAAKAQAEDANEAKSAFLSTVSHELRTPLTSVLGFAKIIRKRLEERIFPAVKIEDQKIKRTMNQVSENLGVVVSEGERLTNLINDVLDLAKIESGRMEWNMKPVFMQDVISRAISATSSLFEQKNLQLIRNIPTDLPMVSADQDKLIQVMINLLSNSVKFTDKGQVSVEAYRDKGQIIIEIQDTGVGIKEDDKHKVFERFRQAGDTLTDKPQGTGLGLPICREIIEHHGGIIWLKSEFGVGSTFFFSIPVLGDHTTGQPIHLDRIVGSLKKQIEHATLPSLESTSTILVVDDDTPIRSLLRQELSEAGYQVTEAANGKAALDMVRLKKPDLIILDVMMPEINGFDVAAVLKNDPDTMDIPIIILSIVEDQERGFRIGVDRYLTKPIDTVKLFHEVDALIEQGVSKKKVLVLDEDQSTVQTLSEILNTRGYKVLETNGDNLLEIATKNRPDIIMLNSLYGSDQELIKSLRFQKGMENVLFFVYQ